MSVKLQRTTFETSRAAEYFDAKELQAQTGQPVENFATVALKELTDNALDACEAAGVAPEVDIEVHEENGLIRLAVTDNGPGIPAETVRKVLDFDVRVSDKSAYRSPTRGAQGNALKTVVGIPHALGCPEPVIIEARGIRHQVRAHVDPAGELRVAHDETPSDTGTGTRVELALPEDDQAFVPEFWARAYPLFNPHTNVRFARMGRSYQGNGHSPETEEIYKSTVAFSDGWRKFLPTDLTSPHWYSTAALERLVFSHIAHARRGGRDLPLGEFVRQFRGLSSTAKAKAVCAQFPEISRLSHFEHHPERVADLLAAMRGASKAPSHNVLGVVGEEHFRERLEDAYEVREFHYKRAKGTFPSGLPFVFEFALAVTDAPGHLYCGVNFSPAFGDPLEGTLIAGPKFKAHGIRGFLQQGHALPAAANWGDSPANVAVAAHIITPAPVFLDRGKTRLRLEEGKTVPKKNETDPASVIGAAIFGAIKPIYQEGERRRRGSRSRRERFYAPPAPKWTQKEIIFGVLPQSVENAGNLFSRRDLYYAARPLCYSHYGWPYNKQLDYGYFSQQLLTEYQEMHGPIPGLYSDPRGHLHEPHTHRVLSLGTREVAAYDFPLYTFDKVLYVEKEGEIPKLREAKLAERYDMAIVSGKGYPAEAARALFERAEGGDYQLFVFHDADIDGYNIARVMREATRRMPGYSVEVVDIGLTVEDAIELHLDSEPFSRKKSIPLMLRRRLSDVEREYFAYRQERFELNAILPNTRRIEYIERKLEESGVRGKVVPPDDKLAELADEMYREKLDDRIEEAIEQFLSVDRIKKTLADEFRERFRLDGARRYIEAGFDEDRALSWREALGAKLDLLQREHAAALNHSVREMVVEAIAAKAPASAEEVESK